MDTAPRPTLRRPELVATAEQPTAAEPARALTVTVVYQLSEAGRKASLLAGGDGKQLQQLQIQVPTSRLHLVAVDPQGRARLKLRPRFHQDASQGIVRTDTVPTYDAPPSLEDLFREAARNHELERTYLAERNAARAKRREAERERRDAIAKAFLDDKTQRALVHPAPSPKRCTLRSPQGRVIFDLTTDEGLAREVPPEAHRRFRADLAAKKEKNMQERAAQLALHEEKKRYIAAWIAEHGSEEQKERYAARLLPLQEAVEALADAAFSPLGSWPVYHRNVRRAQTPLAGDAAGTDTPGVSRDADSASASEWRILGAVQEALPDARVSLREYQLQGRGSGWVSRTVVRTILATLRLGPFSLRREFDLPAVSGTTGLLTSPSCSSARPDPENGL